MSQFKKPLSGAIIVRHAYIFTRYEAQRGVITKAIRTGRDFGFATRAIKKAIGIARTAQMIVTERATPTVRAVTLK